MNILFLLEPRIYNCMQTAHTTNCGKPNFEAQTLKRSC